MRTISHRQAVGASTALSLASAAALLPRMRHEFDTTGRLSASTVAWMYGTYAAHAGTTAAALARRATQVRPLVARTAAGLGFGLAATGCALFTAGMSRFAGAAHISGMNDERLAASGVYRWTRNPQYLGYIGFLTGLATARRSGPAAVLAAGAAAAFAWWVPIEEQHLEQAYGDSYRQYASTAPRWIPIPAAA